MTDIAWIRERPIAHRGYHDLNRTRWENTLSAFAAAADSDATFRLVPIAVAIFTLGRVLFWAGYHVSPNARGLGFNMSFSTSALLAGGAFYLWT